jgi:CPA1 family monovalent cation:H+ antiporter
VPDLNYIQFSPDLIFYVFLPTLIFESAYHIKFRQFKGVFREVTTLATFGLALSILIVSVACHYLLGLPWGVAILFGALISATDPVAVLAIFKELKVPKKLTTIVDGESLINDGTALVAFQFIFKFVVLGVALSLTPTSIGLEFWKLLWSIVVGLIVGTGFGAIFAYAIARSEDRGVQLTLSLVLAHTTFLVAEGLLGVSGILATLAAGLVMGNWGRRKLKPDTNRSFVEIWSFLGFISNALVFLLLGLKLGETDWIEYWGLILVASAIVLLVARPISVYVSLFSTNLTRKGKENKISPAYQAVVVWGGIRGALAAAAALLIPAEFEYAAPLQAMTAGVIVASFVLNATTIKWLLKYTKISVFSRADRFRQAEAELIINEEVLNFLDYLLDKKYISTPIYKNLQAQYAAQHKMVANGLQRLEDSLDNNKRALEKILTHFALGIEMKTYRKLFANNEVSEERFVVLRESIDRQLDRLDHDVLPDERQPRHKYAPEINDRCLLEILLRKMGLHYWADSRALIYKKNRIVSRLQHYRARRISSWKVVLDFERLQSDHPVFKGSEVVDKILVRYRRWNANAEQKMIELEAKYPEIVIPYRVTMADRACLSKVKRLEKDFLEKGFISEKIYDSLEIDLKARTKACVWTPKK